MISVLLVDDDPVLRETAGSYLEKNGGFTVRVSASATAALEELAHTPCDAIVSDYAMPGMDGIAFLHKVRERFDSIPFILFFDTSDSEIAIGALEQGADFYCRKGDDPETRFFELAHLIKKAVQRREIVENLRKSEASLRSSAGQAGEVLIILDKDMIPTYISPSSRSVIGYDPEELVGKSPDFVKKTLFSKNDRAFSDTLKKSLGGKSVLDLPLQIHRKDGRQVPVTVHVIPVMVEGIFSGCEMSIRETTEEPAQNGAFVESESTFRTIFENSPYPIAINSIPGSRFLAVNKAFLSVSGFTAEEVLGKTHLDLGLLTLADSARLIARFVSSGRLENFPLALKAKGGRPVHVLFSTTPITFKKRPAVLTITVEVTHLRRVEEELIQKNEELNAAFEQLSATEEELQSRFNDLEASEAKFRALVENSLDGILITDFDGNLLFANQAAGKIVGVEDYQGVAGKRNVMEFIAPSSKDEVLSDFSRVAGGTDSYLAVYELITGNGREVWVESIGKRIPFGNTTAILVCIRDVTERRKAEAAIRESEAKFSTVFRRSPVALTLVTANDGKFADVSDTFVSNIGYVREDVIGRTAEQVGLFADIADYSRMVSELREKQRLQGYEIRCRTKNGEIRTCRFTSGIIMMAGVPHILSTVEDITEQKAAESAVNALVTGMAETTGRESLDQIARSIHTWLSADCVMIGEILPDGENVRVHSMLLDGEMIRDYSYNLKGTPCENVQDKGFCNYPDDAARIFPESKDLIKFHIRGYAGTPLRNRDGQVIGILCILTRNPLTISASTREIIDIIAIKAATEIERFRLEDSLRRSRQQLEETMDLATIANWECDVTTGMFTFNDRFYSLYGTSAEREGGYLMPAEIYAREFIPPEERSIVFEETKKALATADPDYVSHVEHRIIRRDGEIRHIIVRIAVTKDGRGRTIRTRGANQDITTRKRAEIALRESEGKLRRITDHAPDMIFRMSLPDRRFEYVSPASVALTGFSPEEYYADPQTLFRQVHPKWKEYIETQWNTLRETTVPPAFEFQIIDRAKKTRWFNQRNMLITDDRGNAVAIEGIVTDVTRQKETEIELRRNEQRSLAVSENAGSWIWEVAPDGLYRYSSPAVETILGYRPDELVGKKHFYDLFDPDMREDHEEAARAAFNKREPFKNFINLNTHRNGNAVILNTSGTPLFDEDGNFAGYCGVDEDITERRKSEEALRRTNHQLSLLTSITRHDILNNITSMLGYLTFAERKQTDPSALELFAKIREIITTVRTQIEFTRIYQTIGSHEPQWFSLESILALTYVPVTISLQTDLQGYSIYADPMLEKVFFNLLDNSVRHGERVTAIRITARIFGSDLVIVWEDNGIGIPEEDKERIFERGYGKNSGLGLFLVREVLSLTGITISETGTPGTGARFEITVPKGTYRRTPAGGGPSISSSHP